MALTTSLAGRVRNTSLPKSHALLPLLEAVVNGLQSIDARHKEDIEHGLLVVRIERSGQAEFDLSGGQGRPPLKSIVGFSVEDNGVGFNDDNMRSFETLDSEFKADLGGRGMGRLLWLKAFDRIRVQSSFEAAGDTLSAREFGFSVTREIEHAAEPVGLPATGARVHLDGFKPTYQRSAVKTGEAIAREIFEHCIWYFLRPGGAPEIVVVDEDGSIALQPLFDAYAHSELPRSSIRVGKFTFELQSLQLRASTRSPHPRISWCAANRVVMEESLVGKIPGLYGRLRDEQSNEFTYVSFLSSDFLDEHVRSDRTAFDIDERIAGTPIDDHITLEDIREAVFREVENVLAGSLQYAKEAGRARVNDFVSHRAPRYRPVLARMESIGMTVDPATKDADLELQLHRELQKLEASALADGQVVFAADGSALPDDYDERVQRYLAATSDLNQSDLAAYVSRRRTVLDLLKQMLRLDSDGRYSREDLVHNLLMPMRKSSDEVGSDASNLWILDERLAFHEFLGSDLTLNRTPITQSDSKKEPDILALQLVNHPVLAAEGDTMPLSSIVVVEIKRPMRNDASEGKDPIGQTLDYVKRIRAGGVMTTAGRPLPASQDVPAFCYVIADLTSTMISRCENANLRRTADQLGFFGFNESAKAYVEVVSFDRLLNAATERNRAFFDKLGLPSS